MSFYIKNIPSTKQYICSGSLARKHLYIPFYPFCRCYSEINRNKADQLAIQIALEQLQEQDQFLIAQNDMLKVYHYLYIMYHAKQIMSNVEMKANEVYFTFTDGQI